MKINHILATKRDFVQSKRLHLSLNYYFVNVVEKNLDSNCRLRHHSFRCLGGDGDKNTLLHAFIIARSFCQSTQCSFGCVRVCAITIATVRLLSSLLSICIKRFRAATTYADNEHKFGDHIVAFIKVLWRDANGISSTACTLRHRWHVVLR